MLMIYLTLTEEAPAVTGFMSIQYYRYELIGTFVKEGSDKWALYQMMRGEQG